MRKEYDFTKLSGRKNPYAKKLRKQVTIRMGVDIIEHFKNMSQETGIPYQNPGPLPLVIRVNLHVDEELAGHVSPVGFAVYGTGDHLPAALHDQALEVVLGIAPLVALRSRSPYPASSLAPIRVSRLPALPDNLSAEREGSAAERAGPRPSVGLSLLPGPTRFQAGAHVGREVCALGRRRGERMSRFESEHEFKRVIEKIFEIKITDEEVRMAFQTSPPPWLMNNELFQTGGEFDYNKYRQFFAGPAADPMLLLQIEEYYRDILPRTRLMELVSTGIYVADSELWAMYRDRSEQVQVSYVVLDPEQMIAVGINA